MTAPVDPSASTAASLVAGTALGGQDQLAAWPGLVRLVALLHQTAADDPALHAALAAVSATPDDPGRVVTLAHAVDALASRDSELRDELAHLLDQAQQDPTAGALVTQIAGHARVGKLVTIGRAGQVHVHLPPPPPATVLDRLPPTLVGPLVANLPPRNPIFTGREDLLDQLHQRLHPGQAAAVVQVQAQTLHGLGGVGKTQLAIEYAYRHMSDYDLVWWVIAEQPATIPGQLVALARRLGLPEHAELAETIGALWDALRHRDRWLLVFDNAEEPADLRPWWPPDSGRVLVTSRNPTWSGLAATVVLQVLPRAEAVAFLQHRLGHDDPALDRLAAALGDLPLALEQAGAYLEETATTPGEYLDLLGTHGRALLALGQPATTTQTIATTWAVSLQQLRQQVPAAEDLLVLLAFLAADDIPRTLPVEHATLLPQRLAAAVADPLGYQQAIAALRRYSLVKTGGDALSVHRLVQAVVRQQLDPDQQHRWASAALQLVRAAWPTEPADPAAWAACAVLLPHALTVTGHAERLGIDLESTALLLHESGQYVFERADYPQARELHEHALAIRETRLGPDHPDTATSLHNLAIVLDDQGDVDTARTLHERALAIRETRLGPDHPDTATSLHNLAIVLRDQGDLPNARTLFERALAIRETRLGPDHPDTASSLNNLSGVLHRDDPDTARALAERALAIREARLGPDHPATASSLQRLASVLADQGDLDGARALAERALAIRESRLGPDHPHAAFSLLGLARVLRDQGDLDGARGLYERALSISEARLRPDHPVIAWSLNGLAGILCQQGDLQGARALSERALAISEARLGPDHLTTAWSLFNLAGVLRDQGDLDGARGLYERALSISEARLGPDHHETAGSLDNLAGVLHAQGDLDHARTLYERALAIRQTRLGPDHPDTVRSRERLAAVVAALENRQ
jgi:tetratricopeptide (TPR) repeat protein